MSKNIQATAERTNLPDTPVLPEDIETAIRDTLAMLAEVDRTYQQRRDAIRRSAASIVQKKHLRGDVDRLHRKDREAYVLRLADLHYRRIRASLFRTMH
jgi:hypothetical protein